MGKRIVISLIPIILLLPPVAFLLKASAGRERIAAPTIEQTDLNSFLNNSVSDTSSLEGLDERVMAFMRQWELKGVSLGIMRNDSLLYAKGYGWADEAEGVEMQPYHRLRMASVSKLITATGIMLLQEQGKLSLQDSVFGEYGILGQEAYASSITDKNHYKIRVEHLLRHQGGFGVGGGDPMFSTRAIMVNNGLQEAPDNDQLLECVLKRRLSYMPGSTQSYSNLGYLILSKIIEKISGMPYEDFIQEYVFAPSGISGFRIANNYYEEKHPQEARYYVPRNEALIAEFNNSGRMVSKCYGGNDVKSLSGAGAWTGSVPELMKFVASIDGRPEVNDIISQGSVGRMVEYIDESVFPLGWNDTRPQSGWMRSGSFSGTSALVKYYPDGECWIMITNTSNWRASRFSYTISALFNELRNDFSASLPARTFFTTEL